LLKSQPAERKVKTKKAVFPFTLTFFIFPLSFFLVFTLSFLLSLR